jgi:hypothetical protein
MIKFIPLEYYYDVYIYFSLFLVLFILLHSYVLKINDIKNINFLRITGIIFLFLSIFYLGLRPISGYVFGDMSTYATYFKNYALGQPVHVEKDYLFHYYMKLMSNIVNVHGFFLITDFLYIFPMYLISKTHFKDFWFYSFFMFLVSMSFFSYGTNGIRNGVATSMFLWGLCFYNRKSILAVFFILAAMFHKTLLLPILAYVLATIYNNPKFYLKSWFLSIPASLIAGGIWITLFTNLGFGDDRLAGYLSSEMDSESFSRIGFRWDFLFYSAFAVFAGWYFIFKKKFKDEFYNKIYATYLICNGFWILVIRANFSNRFAYLSWFLMSFIIIYPILKERLFKDQEIIIAKIIFAYFLFTFFMYFIYYADKH